MFGQLELLGTQMGPNGPPVQKERLKSPQKSPIPENQAIWVIFGHFGQNGHFGHFGQPFPNQDGRAEKKYHLESGLNQRDEGAHGFFVERVPVVPRSKTSTGGV